MGKEPGGIKNLDVENSEICHLVVKCSLGNLITKRFVIFSEILIIKIGVKMNLSMLKKKYDAGSVSRIPTKSILRPFGLMSPIRQRRAQRRLAGHIAA